MSDQDKPSRPPNGCGTDSPDWHGQTYWNDDDRRRDYCSQVCADARRHVVPADHPGPWTWNRRHDADQPDPHSDPWVTDANGAIVLSAARPASSLACELIRLAPELEKRLRAAADAFERVMRMWTYDGERPGDMADRDLARLELRLIRDRLAALDEVRAT